jgi:hypothetical protein
MEMSFVPCGQRAGPQAGRLCHLTVRPGGCSLTAMIRSLVFAVCAAAILPCAAQKKSGPMKNPADDPKLPRVLLIGDSISIGYTVGVRGELKGKANVHRIPTNGGPTTRGLESIDAWLGDGKWDVIHFNWGLHDLAYRNKETGKGLDKAEGKLSTTLEDYAANLDKLVVRMKKTEGEADFCDHHAGAGGGAGKKGRRRPEVQRGGGEGDEEARGGRERPARGDGGEDGRVRDAARERALQAGRDRRCWRSRWRR